VSFKLDRMAKPLMVELFAGLHGWGEGAIAEGFRVIGFDLVDMCAELGVKRPKGIDLVIQDVLTLHGSQFRNAAVIVASPPCQEYSYMAMPWSRAKQIAGALRGEVPFPDGYKGSVTIEQLRALFDACFRIAKEAGVPLVVENVKGAQPWVGEARARYGSFYFWGDIGSVGGAIAGAAPKFGQIIRAARAQKRNPDGTNHPQGSWFKIADSKNRGTKGNGGTWFTPENSPDTRGQVGNPVSVPSRLKVQTRIANIRDGHSHTRHLTNSDSRKAASAQIAKIPFPLAQHIARVFKP
jgi:hypothetical protein